MSEIIPFFWFLVIDIPSCFLFLSVENKLVQAAEEHINYCEKFTTQLKLEKNNFFKNNRGQNSCNFSKKKSAVNCSISHIPFLFSLTVHKIGVKNK